MVDSIERFINERILVADEMIAKYGNSKIHDGDVILTYAR
jgi:translation initiation factor 2B subunit (eIF-2B alpha/beta/delta family)